MLKNKIIILILIIMTVFYFIRREYLYFTFERGYTEEMYILKEKIRKNPIHLVDGVPNPNFPDSVENNTTYEGIDSNNNKIRDDVELWINYNARDINERMAMRQMASAYNAKLISEVVSIDNSGLRNTYEKIFKAAEKSDSCLINICKLINNKKHNSIDCLDYRDRLQVILLNNKFRRVLVNDILLKGNSTISYVNDYSKCDFKPQKEDL